MSDLLDQISALDAAIGNSSQLTADQARARRAEFARFRQSIASDIATPAPGSTTTVGGATITHRPDIMAQQAAAQGEPGYLPVKETLAKGENVAGALIQQPAPTHPAELSKIGTATR